jgi:hypothetical protein
MNKLTHNKQSDRGVDRELQELTSAINTLIDKVADPGTSAPTDLDKANVQVITTGNNEYCLAVRTTDGFVTSAPGILEKVDTLSQSYRSNLASYKKISASVAEYDSEIGVDKLVVQQVVTGAQVTCKSGAKLAQSCILPKAGEGIDIFIEEVENYSGHVFADGDIVCIRKLIRTSNTVVTNSSAWGVVTYIERIVPEAYPSTPQQKYRFVRSILPNSGSATGPMPKGTSVMDYGTTGNGSIELTAIDGINGRNSPHVSIYSWTTHPLSGNLEKVRMGNLQGIYSPTWGELTGYGLWAKDDIYLEGNCYVKGNLTFTNAGSISIASFNNDAGFVTAAGAGAVTTYSATEPASKKTGDIWMDTSITTPVVKYIMKRYNGSTWDNFSVYMNGSGIYTESITAGQITTGSLTGQTITGGTFTGGIFQTATSGTRIEISYATNSLYTYDSTGLAGSLNSTGGFVSLTAYSGRFLSLIGGNNQSLYLDDNSNLISTSCNFTVDGVVTATGGNSTDWNEAHGWGDHASGGYAPSTQGAIWHTSLLGSGLYVAASSGGAVTTQLSYVALDINGTIYDLFARAHA